MSLIPLDDRVILKRCEAMDTTPGGIILPDTAKEKPQEFEVISVGPGTLSDGKRVALTVKVGDRVLASKWGGTEVKHNGDELVVMRESDILAIIKK